MKKTLLLLLVAMSVSLSGFAQKGRQAVGVDILPSRFFELDQFEVGVGVKYQYNLTDYIRLNPNVNIISTKHECGGYDDYDDRFTILMAGVDVNAFFISNNRFRPYFIAGLYCGYFEVCCDENWYKFSEALPAARLGIGVDYRMTYDLSLQIELAYNTSLGADYLNNITDFYCDSWYRTTAFQTLRLGIGVTYNF